MDLGKHNFIIGSSLNGSVDDVVFYNIALTDEEVVDLYNGEFP